MKRIQSPNILVLMADPSPLMLVLTTEGIARAIALAEALLERRLVACVSLQPLQSLYRWNGELQRETEVQLLLKPASINCRGCRRP